MYFISHDVLLDHICYRWNSKCKAYLQHCLKPIQKGQLLGKARPQILENRQISKSTCREDCQIAKDSIVESNSVQSHTRLHLMVALLYATINSYAGTPSLLENKEAT